MLRLRPFVSHRLCRPAKVLAKVLGQSVFAYDLQCVELLAKRSQIPNPESETKNTTRSSFVPKAHTNSVATMVP
jgi:hypothetical protein